MLIKDNNGYFFYEKEISEEEYNEILLMVKNPPIAPEGWAYNLMENLEWELVEIFEEEDPELSELETLEILLGGEII